MNLSIGTPMYGGMCFAKYTQSMLSLNEYFCKQPNSSMTTIYLFNQSLITLARNTIVHKFLNNTNSSHLFFIDADISFKTEDVIRMLNYDKDIILGGYPLKDINFKNIIGKKDNLEDYSGMYNISPVKNINKTKPFEVKWGGCGFMLISRKVFKKMIHSTEYFIYNNEKIYKFFSSGKIKEDSNFLPEDFNFCYNFRKLGGKIFLDPLCKLTHFGNYEFSGNCFNI
jgi:hypothetical protein